MTPTYTQIKPLWQNLNNIYGTAFALRIDTVLFYLSRTFYLAISIMLANLLTRKNRLCQGDSQSSWPSRSQSRVVHSNVICIAAGVSVRVRAPYCLSDKISRSSHNFTLPSSPGWRGVIYSKPMDDFQICRVCVPTTIGLSQTSRTREEAFSPYSERFMQTFLVPVCIHTKHACPKT